MLAAYANERQLKWPLVYDDDRDSGSGDIWKT